VRLTLLLTSPRVAPGLLSWAAWSAVASAGRRLASSGATPLARAVAEAGHLVQTLPRPTPERLLEAVRGGGVDVVWLLDEVERDALVPGLLQAAGGVQVELLHASYDVPGARLLDLVAVMDRLRAECPWDREQTHRSLARYLLEETYETLEAIESGDRAHLREELGDLLLQVYFHARIAAEDPEHGFGVDDVAAGIVDKLVRRHPHVFAREVGSEAPTTGQVEASWERLKAVEKGRTSVLDGIPQALPALALADKVLGRAAGVGVRPGVQASVQVGGEATADAAGDEGAAVLGERLLALVIEARAAGVDAEQALRDTVRRLVATVRAAETG
jgi:XTP/dITP diphosphohydrolase